MNNLTVWMEQAGTQKPVGYIETAGPASGEFRYGEEYLADPSAKGISLSLPLQAEAFSAERTKAYFDGLLPEGFTRRSVAEWMKTDERDYLTILERLGRECLGAIRIAGEENEPEEDAYISLSPQDVRDLAEEGVSASTELVTKAHLSLTGASGKVGLYYDEASGNWYLPKGNAPSTHIVKLSHVRLNHIVVNEKLCMMTAAKLGISVPDSFIIDTGTGRDEDVLFATARYDRKMGKDRMLGGLPRPYRLHQEDFAQAMGIPANRKYEQPGDLYFAKMMDVLRRYSSNPIADQQALWDMMAYDYFVGNTDSHIKNFSLLYSEDLKTVRLAPCYDVISTMVYKSSTDELALAIGENRVLQKLCRDDFAVAAEQAGLGAKAFLKRMDLMANGVEMYLRESAAELKQAGFREAEQIAEAILRVGGMAYWK